jgi:hypothetical protein
VASSVLNTQQILRRQRRLKVPTSCGHINIITIRCSQCLAFVLNTFVLYLNKSGQFCASFEQIFIPRTVDQKEESVEVKVSLIYIYEKHQGIEGCSNSNRDFKDAMDSFICVSSTPHARSVQCSLRQTFTVIITAVPLTSLRDSSTQYGVRSKNEQFLN